MEGAHRAQESREDQIYRRIELVSNFAVPRTNNGYSHMSDERSSGKHIDEIKEAGYELPAVNQIEVSIIRLPTPPYLS